MRGRVDCRFSAGDRWRRLPGISADAVARSCRVPGLARRAMPVVRRYDDGLGMHAELAADGGTDRPAR